MMSKIRRSR